MTPGTTGITEGSIMVMDTDTVMQVTLKFSPEEIRKAGGFTMKLRSHGNPDFGQYAPVSEPEIVTGGLTLAEMRSHAEAYRDKWELGGGNWAAPVVKLGKKVVGHFSYNLRFWEGSSRQWTSTTREIQIEADVKGGAL